METIYSSDTLTVFFNRGRPASAPPADPAFVTFEGIGVEQRNRVGHPVKPFGESLAGKLGIDMVHVVPRGAEWYHYRDMEDCLARLREVVGPSTIAYGSSMGAYAAAHFADRLGVSRGLCLSPQVSIQRRVVPSEKRWQNFAEKIEFLHDDVIAPRRAKLWIFADDRFEAEMEHVRRIAESGPHEIIGVPNGGHPVGPALLEGRVLSRLIDAFLEGSEDAAAFREMIATSVRTTPSTLVQQSIGRDTPERIMLLRQALAINERHRKARLQLGFLLLRLGESEEAHELLCPLITSRNTRLCDMYTRICGKFGVEPVLLDEAARARHVPPGRDGKDGRQRPKQRRQRQQRAARQVRS